MRHAEELEPERGTAIRSADEYPVVLRYDGSRARPSRVLLMANGLWRVDWIEGLVSLYRSDPRGHLKLGYDPRHLRTWRASSERGEKHAPCRIMGLAHRRT